MTNIEKIGKPNLLKKLNKNIVLNVIRREGLLSRAKASKITGISKPTMSNIISSLKKDNLIVVAGIGEPAKEGGKKPTLYKFNENYGYMIGAEVRIEELLIILTNYNARIIQSLVTRIPKKISKEKFIKKLFYCFNSIIKNSKIDISELKGIGIGFHGIVDHGKGILKFASHFPEWDKDINFGEIISEKFKVNTYLENQNRMIVCAEKIFGSGKDYNNIVIINTEEGIGTGIIIKGDIYKGKDFIAGEIGHTIINPGGPRCHCGKYGCAETMISTRAIKDNVKADILNDKDSILYKKFSRNIDSINIKNIFDAYLLGDRFIEGIMDKIEDWFSIFVSNIILSYNPEIIIIEGEYVMASDKFIKRIEKKVKEKILPALDINPIIKFSKLGKFAGPLGAVSLILNKEIHFSSVWED